MNASVNDRIWLDEALISAVGQQPRINRRRIEFWPEHSEDAELRNAIAADDRLAALFGSLPVADPIKHWAKGSILPKELEPAHFKLVPSEFIAHARSRAPRDPQPTASGFSAWLYSLYSNAYGSDEDQDRGKVVEKEVLERRRAIALSNDNMFLRECMSDWSLLHNGIDGNQNPHKTYIEIEDLKVGVRPLRVSPDLLYRNDRKSKIVIVEIKHTRMVIPTNLWPNIWGQLWCYAQLPMVRDAASVAVVGEIWGDRWTPRHRSEGMRLGGEHLIVMRASVQRDPRETTFDRFFRELFNIYAGA